MSQTIIRAQFQPWYHGIGFVIMNDLENGTQGIAKIIEFEKITKGHQTIDPSLVLNQNAAQTLMDDLWNCGIRPTEKVGTVGQLQATEKHLQDMQKIAFNRLSIPHKVNGKE